MDKVSHVRGIILGMAFSLLLLPTYIVLAYPPKAQQVTVDSSWIKDLPPLIVLSVLMFLTLYFVLKFITDRQNRIPVKTAEGQPDKSMSMNEMIGITFTKLLEFMEDSAKQNREIIQSSATQNQTILAAFTDQVREILRDVNTHTETNTREISSLKDELIQGRGNQMTAILEVSDRLRDSVHQMQAQVGQRNEQLERVNGGIGYLQIGQTKMQKDLESLLDETKKIMQLMSDVVTRIESIGQEEKSVKDELLSLHGDVKSISTRLDKIIETGIPLINVATPKPDEPLTKPDSPVE